MLLLDNADRAVAVNDIDGKWEGQFGQVELVDHVHQEIKQKRSHAKINLGLLLDQVQVWSCFQVQVQEMVVNVKLILVNVGLVGLVLG